jgi:hypothetical protein
MARTAAEIEATIDAQVAGTVLSGLSGSSTSVWDAIKKVVAWAISIHEQVFDKHKVEVQSIADAAIAGTDDWLVAQAKYWQYGNPSLAVDSNTRLTYGYDIADANLVKFAAVTPYRSTALLKVANADGDGLPVPLDAGQVVAFKAYIQKIQLAGTKISVRSVASDELKVVVVVNYDGLYVQATVEAAVLAAVKAYLRLNLSIDGRVHRQKLEAAILGVDGVTDLKLTTLAARRAGAGAWVNFFDGGRYYDCFAGHIQLNAGASSFTYLTTL